MRTLITRLGASVTLTIILTIVAHGLLRGVLGRGEQERPIDVISGYETSYISQARLMLLSGLELRSVDRPTIFVVGASGVQTGFRPSEISAHLPDFEVANLSISFANISETLEAANIIERAARPEILSKSVLVVGVTYEMFTADTRRWRFSTAVPFEDIDAGVIRSDLARARSRAFLFSSAEFLSNQNTPSWMMASIGEHYRHYMRFYTRIPEGPLKGALPLAQIWSFKFPFELRAGSGNKEVEKTKAFDNMASLGPKFPKISGERAVTYDEQLEKLDDIARSANQVGMRVVIVNMPMKTSYLATVPDLDSANARIRAYVSRLSPRYAVSYLDMSRVIQDDKFMDSAHPVKGTTNDWAERLAAFVMATSG